MARRKRNYHAARDASVVTYGDFGASLDADRDIGTGHFNYYGSPGVWARGDIFGTITAGRNIGHWDHQYGYAYDAAADYDIFSFGRITAVITATNPSGSPTGGRIGSVAAWDEIDGLIEASHSIQLVRSGDAVSATVVAPYIGSIIEHDSTITTAYPYPTTPDSIKPEVLAEAQSAYDQVLAARTGITDDIAALLADFTAQKTQALAELTQQQAAVDAVLAETATTLQDKVADKINETFQAELSAARASSEEIAKLRELAESEKKTLEDARKKAKSDGDAAYQRALDEKEKILAQLTDFDRQMLELKNQDAREAEFFRGVRVRNFDRYRLAVLGKIAGLDPSGLFIDPTWVISVEDPTSNPSEGPGFWESMIPILGPAKLARYDWQHGRYGWCAFNTAMAVSDVFIVKSLAVGLTKGLVRISGSFSWRAVKRWLLKEGFAEPGQHVHHWLITQGGKPGAQVTLRGIFRDQWGRAIPKCIKNQPWNLMPMKSEALHNLAHGYGPLTHGYGPLADSLRGALGPFVVGTPTWAKAFTFSTFGRYFELIREDYWD